MKKYVEGFDQFQEKIMVQWCEQHDLTLIPQIYSNSLDGSDFLGGYGIWLCDRRITLIQIDSEYWDFSRLFSERKKRRWMAKVEWLQSREVSKEKGRERLDDLIFDLQYKGN